MLNLELRSYNKVLVCLCCFLIFIFLIGLCDAYKISVSPPSIYFEGNLFEKECKIIMVWTDKPGYTEVNDVWTNNLDNKVVWEYELVSSELGIKLEYERLFYLDGEKEFKICLVSSKEGEYKGALIFKPRNRGVELVVWLNPESGEFVKNELIKGSEEKARRQGISLISGEVVKENFTFSKIWVLGSSILLLVVLLFLIVFLLIKS